MIAIFLKRNVIIAQSQVNNFKGLTSGVDQDVEWFNIAVHDSIGVQIMEPLEELFHIDFNICQRQTWVEVSEVNVGTVLEDEAGCLEVRTLNDLLYLGNVFVIE